VTYFVFSGSAGQARAVTDDRTGAKLPQVQGGWIYERDVDHGSLDSLPTSATPGQIEDGVKRQGYFLWPQEPKEER
jgi:hypothetical protein